MTIIATICARGGSQGLPGKNIKNLLGKPLIAHTIEHALSTPEIDYVFVSTDDPEIARIAEQWGAIVPFLRPKELATSSAAKIPVIKHMVEWVKNNVGIPKKIIDLDPTSPLRSLDDIQTCIKLLDNTCDVVITAYESDKNPYFNMVEYTNNHDVRIVKGDGTCVARQLSPKVYSMNGSVYAWHETTLEKGLWNGRVKMHVMPRERSIDIDSYLDFQLVELLLKERHAKT